MGAAFSSTASAQDSIPAPDQTFQGKVGRTYKDSDPAKPHRPVQAPADAPNILVIMLDDAGFGQYQTFGGAIPSPTMDRLANNGLRYNRFHTAGICSPTRAALLTGRNPHNAGVGIVTELSTGYDGYTGVMPRSTAPVARVLRDNGYATAMFGKNHNTPANEGGPAGPFNNWPTGFGFDYFYGFNAWGTSQWQPLLFENTKAVPPSIDPEYHLNRDMMDRAISWVQAEQAASPERPYFLYIATGATHAPHHAPQEWIDKFKGQFDAGWDVYRDLAFSRQKALGVVPADAQLTPRPEGVPAWESLSDEQKRVNAHQMEVMAGFAAYTDYELGRLVDAVRQQPDGDNTIIIFIAGDNGASAEGAEQGTLNEIAPSNGMEKESKPSLATLRDLGSAKWNNNYPAGWAWAMNTPFKYYKQVVSHLGAIRNPMIISWPTGIKAQGEVRQHYSDVTDITPTLLAAAGIESPARVDGIAQKAMDGVSLIPTFRNAQSPEIRETQYFEVFGNRAIYDKGWMASAKLADPWNPHRARLDPDKVTWELYNLDKDFSQAHDLATENPQRLEELKQVWWREAEKNNVLPLDWRAGERLAGMVEAGTRTDFTFYPGLSGLPEAMSPNVKNRSWSISAKGNFGPGDEGVLITQGGFTGGWALSVQKGYVQFDYSLAALEHTRILADAPLPAGTREIGLNFAYEGKEGERGRGGTVTLLADGKVMATGRLTRTVTGLFAIHEGLDVGADYGSPVADYPFPAPFSGELKTVQVTLQ
ncbi:MAG: arylsulfatase [Sphingomonadaceae bacterium]